MSDAALIPDRRRKHFPEGGGPKPSRSHRRIGRAGIAAARDVLEASTPTEPDKDRVHVSHSVETTQRARRGIARMRSALKEART